MKFMNTELTRLRAMSRSRFFGYLVFGGAFAGLLAWVLVFSGAIVFGFDKPTLSSLLFAIPRGSLYGVVMGLLLRWWWRNGQ